MKLLNLILLNFLLLTTCMFSFVASKNDESMQIKIGMNSAYYQEAYVKASNTDGGDFFGQSVAISGDTMIVGALREDSNEIIDLINY